MFDIEQELKKLPQKPGVYIMRDKYESILYIGKALVLKNRVKQYFRASSNLSPRIKTMVSKIDRFEYIVTSSELEALVLECNLIKAHKPRYNVLLKDDKTYPFIKVTLDEEYPRVFITRKTLKDGAKYFGPFTNVTAVKEILVFLKKIFPLRSCNKEFPKDIGKDRPCLNFHINQCLAPCQGGVNAQDYREMIAEICDFLDGKQSEVLKKLHSQMEDASSNMDYERAAVFRDRINAANKLAEKQKVTEPGDNKNDIDIIGLARSTDDACIQIFFVRGGKLVGRENFIFKGMADAADSEVIGAFIKQYYGMAVHIPQNILLSATTDEDRVMEEWLSQKRKGKVEIKVPQKGDKRNLLDMAERNAEIELQRLGVGYEVALDELRELLKIADKIVRIEAFDISNLKNTAVVGSMVVFEGKLDKRQYKRYKIKTVKGQNDVGCMNEVISRRLRRMVELSEGHDDINGAFARKPDLILVDGGLGQMNAALDAAREIGVNVNVAGMVKDNRHRTKGLLLPDGNEVELKKFPKVLKLVAEIQEEVHRFAIDYHRKLFQKQSIHSQLDEINGIGSARKRELFKYFGSIEAIKAAEINELEKAKGMNRKAAEVVYEYFHN